MKTKKPQPSTLEAKTEAFKKEVNFSGLNEEQKRIYSAFVFRRAKPYRFAVNDADGNTVRFLLYTNKTDDGVLHIMGKHYRGVTGPVTATEIVNLCDVIRNGVMTSDGKSITYTWIKGASTLKLIVGLKRSKTGENVLKKLWQQRRKPKSLTGKKSLKRLQENSINPWTSCLRTLTRKSVNLHSQ